MSDDVNAWKILENLNHPQDFIKMLYEDKDINFWWDMMKITGMGDNIFLKNYDKELHEAINDLYSRLRIIGIKPDDIYEIITYHGNKILSWKRVYDEINNQNKVSDSDNEGT